MQHQSYYTQAIGQPYPDYPNMPGYAQYSGYGQAPNGQPPNGQPPPRTDMLRVSTPGGILGSAYGVASFAGGIAGAYHGYKRNNSIGWALWWSFAGAAVPFITLPIAYAQGFAKRKKG